MSKPLLDRGPDETSRSDAAVPGGTGEAELQRELTRVRELLEAGDLKAARTLAEHLETKWPGSPQAATAARILAPPRVEIRASEPARSLDREYAWLRAHADEHPGCWLAVLGDELLAAHPDLRVVLAKTREVSNGDNALLHCQPRTEGQN
jgi:hypothetical protein